MAVYDLILSFPVEIIGIWKRRFGIGMILYVSLRYGPVISMILEVLGRFFIPQDLIVSIQLQYVLLIPYVLPRGKNQHQHSFG